MSDQPNSSSQHLSFLADFAAAMKYAEHEEAKGRHGSTATEYERVRQLGEMLVAGFNDPEFEAGTYHPAGATRLLAVRDLPDNAGVMVVVQYRGKEHGLKVDFEELQRTSGQPQNQIDLIGRWRKELPSSATIINKDVVMGKARRVTPPPPVEKPQRSSAGKARTKPQRKA